MADSEENVLSKKGQVFLIVIWLLLLLTVFTIGLGHRVAGSLKQRQYHSARIRAYCLAETTLNAVIAGIENKTALPKNLPGLVVTDEESKINVNVANLELLVSLCENNKISDPEAVAKNILMWRGELADSEKTYETSLGYRPKGAGLSSVAELMMVRGIDEKSFNRIKDQVTVFGSGSINLNTVSLDTLKIVAQGLAKKLSIDPGFADNVAMQIIEKRNSRGGKFNDKSEINITFLQAEENSVYNLLVDNSLLEPDNFLIEVTASVGKIRYRLSGVYAHSQKKIIYRHES